MIWIHNIDGLNISFDIDVARGLMKAKDLLLKASYLRLTINKLFYRNVFD